MGRLKSLPARLAKMPPRLQHSTDQHGHSAEAEPWRKWYSTARWRRLRLEVLDRDDYTCQCGCGVAEGDLSKLVADHVRPHRGDAALFWNKANLRTLRASPCHNKIKQAEEARARALGRY